MAINFTLVNESSDSPINGSIMANARVWIDDIDNFVAFNLTWDTSDWTYGLCLTPADAEYNIYAQMEYVDDGLVMAEKTYYITNTTVNNETTNISLYLTPGTTQTSFEVRDIDDDPVAEAIIKVLSYDLGTDSYKVTEIVKTDSDGEAFAQIIQDTQFYRFIVEVNGEQFFFSEPQKIDSLSNIFRISLTADPFETIQTLDNVVTSLTFDNDTNTFTYTFNDLTGDVNLACLRVTRRTYSGDTLINKTCVNSNAGSIDITISNPGTSLYIATGVIQINPERVTDTFAKHFDTTFTTWGDEGLMMTFLMVSTIVLVGVFSPVIAIILGLAALIFAIVMGLFHLTWTTMMGLIIVGGIAMYKQSKK